MNDVTLRVVGPDGEDLGETVPLAAATAPSWTVAQLIEQRLALKAYIEKQKAEFDKILAPYVAGKEAIDAKLLDMCNEQGVDSLKARGVGTAYVSNILTAKVIDKEALVEFACANWREFGSELLIIKAATEPVQRLLDEGRLPGCLEISFAKRLNVRKS
jgi:hypothetical protein